jgi:hypothetical protein
MFQTDYTTRFSLLRAHELTEACDDRQMRVLWHRRVTVAPEAYRHSSRLCAINDNLKSGRCGQAVARHQQGGTPSGDENVKSLA